MKVSINLSERVAQRLGEIVKADNTNASVVCEAALLMYERVDHGTRLQLQRELLAQRRPQTPLSWRTHFWTALAEEFNTEDMARGNQRYLMAARPYGGFQVIFDAAHAMQAGHEDEIVVFTDTAPPYTDKTVRIGDSWTFTVTESVYDAARTVAGWIRANEHRLK